MIVLGLSGLPHVQEYLLRLHLDPSPLHQRSCQGLDSAAVLIIGGRLVAATSEGRLTGEKGLGRLPAQQIAGCLAEAGITLDDVDLKVRRADGVQAPRVGAPLDPRAPRRRPDRGWEQRRHPIARGVPPLRPRWCSTRIRRTLRGRVRNAPSFGWCRVLRPTSAEASRLADLGRPVPRPRRTVGAAAADALTRRTSRVSSLYPVAPEGFTAEPLTVDALLEQTADAPRRWRLHPAAYDATYLSTVFAELEAVEPVRGEVVRQLVRDHDGRVRGRLVASAPAGGIPGPAAGRRRPRTEPRARPRIADADVDHVIADADARGAVAAADQLTAPLADAVRTRRCWFGRRCGRWPTEDTSLLPALDTEGPLLARLEGEWWMGHHLLYRGGNTTT